MLKINNLDLTPYNSYRIKSIASVALFPENIKDVENIYTQYNTNQIVVLGHGNNIILSKPYYDHTKIFVFLHHLQKFELHSNALYCESGCSLKEMSILAYGAGLSGLETFFDIPGSIGGAIYMNAGMNTEEILKLTQLVGYFNFEKSNIEYYQQNEIEYGYRYTCFQKKRGIILFAELTLSSGDKKEILQKMFTIRKNRWDKQPRDLPNAGSVFKRPKGHYVGTMIEQLGLKGLSVGGAKISEKHAGFIVNFNHATGYDILKLIEIVKEKVYNSFNIELELEQIII